MYYAATLSAKEEVADEDGRDDAGKVGQEAAGDGMAGLADAYAAEVYGKDVEGGVGSTLEEAGEAAHEGVGTIGGHGIDHEATGTATAEGLHQGGGQGTHKLGIAAHEGYAPGDAVDEEVHGSRGTEHADGYEDGHEVGDDAHGGLEAFLGSFDEGFVHVDLLAHTGNDEAGDDGAEEDVGKGGGHDIHLLARHGAEAPYDERHQSAQGTDEEEQGAVKEVDALVQAGDDETYHGGEEGGQEDGHKHIGGLGGTHLGTVYHDADGYERETRGVEHKEHDHGVGGGVLLCIELLQLLHGLEAHGGGGIVEPEHVGGKVHEDGARHGMSLGDIGEDLGEHGGQPARYHIDHAALLANAHDAEPQGEHTREAERDLEG